MTSGKAIVIALRGLFVIAAALSTELVTSLLPTGEVSTLTDIQEYVSNEGNTQVETLSENVNEAIDTDQRQTLLGINQGKDLERLTSDVMNQKVSPNDLAESKELVKLDNTLACLKNTLRSTWERQSFGCIAWTTLRSSRTSYVGETGMWDGHMNAITALLNLFAATCHIHYAKSDQLYFQEMSKRPSTYPWLHQNFVEEYHTVRRTEREWAGLWTDIVIE